MLSLCMPAALVCKSASTWSHASLQDDSCAPGTAGTAGDPHLGAVAHCGEAVHVRAHRSVVDGRVCGDALQALHRRQAVHLDVCGVFKFKLLYWAKYTTCRRRLDNTAGERANAHTLNAPRLAGRPTTCFRSVFSHTLMVRSLLQQNICVLPAASQRRKHHHLTCTGSHMAPCTMRCARVRAQRHLSAPWQCAAHCSRCQPRCP